MNNFLKKATALGLFSLTLLSAQAQKTPVGYVMSESGCASGGYDYYFFANGVVHMKCEGCQEYPLIWTGTWTQSGDKINMKFTKEYAGIGEGAPHYPVGSVNTYDVYKATSKTINETQTNVWGKNPTVTDPDGCEVVKKHDLTNPDFRSNWIGKGFVGKYPQVSQKLLTAAELKKYSKAELKIMRNEVFARYGYIFKSEDMKNYFGKQDYRGYMSDVTAFLSDIEIKNVDLIKKAESTAK